MTLWIALAALTAAALALLLLPLLRPRSRAAARVDYDLAVYSDQLREVDLDVERGLLTAPQAEAARTEIKRRMLAAAERAKTPGTAAADGRAVAVALAVLLPVGAGAMYAYLGSPHLPGLPYAERPKAETVAHDQLQQMAGLVDRLAERLKEQPEDARGWQMLGRSARALERYDQAADAFRRAIALGVDDSETLSMFGETLVAANGGSVVPEAVQAFGRALAKDAGDVRAKFYLGMERLQQGDGAGGIAIWRDLEQTSPPDAEWLAPLRQQIAAAAAEFKLDPAAIPPKAPEAATAQAPAAAPPGLKGFDDEQRQMIAGMVAGLEEKLKANPGDAEGWKRLGRAYRVMERLEDAKAAYAKAVELQPTDAATRLAYADVLLALAPGSGTLPADFVAELRQVLALQADNPDALYYVGLAEAQAGNIGEAKTLWNRLLATMTPGSAEHDGLKQQIDMLGG